MTGPENPALEASFLRQLDHRHVEQLLEDAVHLRLPPGGSIYREGDQPRAGLVVDGLLRVFMESPAGRQVTVRYAGPGDVLGIAAAVGGPPPVSVEAVIESELRMMSVERILRLGALEPAVAMALAEELTRRLYETLHELAGNAFSPVPERVARHVLDLAVGTREPGGALTATVTHQELADAVASSREVVSRALADLRRSGTLETGPAGLHIRDPQKLHAIATSSVR